MQCCFPAWPGFNSQHLANRPLVSLRVDGLIHANPAKDTGQAVGYALISLLSPVHIYPLK
jgi:hypothetical protein